MSDYKTDASSLDTRRQTSADATGIPGLSSLIQFRLSNNSSSDFSPSLVHLNFDVTKFKLELFSEHRIHLPDSIARSVHRRQAEFFFGRCAARFALSALLNDEYQAQQSISIGALGAPQWPPGIIGSISHNNVKVAAVACKQDQVRGIGIDIEAMIGPESRNAIIGSVIDVDELSLVQAVSRLTSIDELLTIAFSAKESLYKGLFNEVKQYIDFDVAKIAEIDLSSQIITLRLAKNLSPLLMRGSEYQISFHKLDSQTILTHFVY